MNAFEVPPTSRKAIKRLTKAIRKMFGMEDAAFFPVIHFMETVLPAIDRDFCYEIVDDKEMGMDHANYNPATHTMKIRSSVYEGAYAGNGRDRFTIAHEIGHVFLHSKVDLALSRVDKSRKVPAFRDPEWQANTFASSIMMDDKVIENMTVEQIVRECGASYSAASIAYGNRKNG